MTATIAPEHLEKYFAIARKALHVAKIIAGTDQDRKHAQKILSLAEQYIKDADHFHKQGDDVRAFACVNYASGWLDCGAALGLLEGKNSDLERWST